MVKGHLTLEAKYGYDGSGRLAESTTYFGDGRVDNSQSYEYDSDGNADVVEVHAGDGRLLHGWRYLYKLDSQGNWIQRTGEDEQPHPQTPEDPEIIYRAIRYYTPK